MTYFDKSISFGIRKLELKQIEAIVNDYKGLYDNSSHFVRVAVIKLIKEHKRGKIDYEKRPRKDE